MTLRLKLVSAALCAMPWVSSWAQDAGVHEGSLALAERMIAGCLEYAAAHDLPALSVVVVDAGGSLIAGRRQDGAMPVASDAALLKARTSARTNLPSALLAGVIETDQATRDAFVSLQLTAMAGGVPFAIDGRIGAVGVSGGTLEQDAACATQAVAAAHPTSDEPQ